MTLGAASTQEIEWFDKEAENEEEVTNQRGQILWIRGLNRLQHQVMQLVNTEYAAFSKLLVVLECILLARFMLRAMFYDFQLLQY